MAASSRVARGGSAGSAAAESRPVLLATLRAPFDRQAASFAVEAAVESGQPLIVAVIVELEPLPLSIVLGYDQIDSPSEAESFRAPAELAHSLGVHVERLRIRSPRPIEALIELVTERQPGLLVFGPDRTKLSARRYRNVVKALQERVSCLVWIAEG
jgi:hypothetical protein